MWFARFEVLKFDHGEKWMFSATRSEEDLEDPQPYVFFSGPTSWCLPRKWPATPRRAASSPRVQEADDWNGKVGKIHEHPPFLATTLAMSFEFIIFIIFIVFIPFFDWWNSEKLTVSVQVPWFPWILARLAAWLGSLEAEFQEMVDAHLIGNDLIRKTASLG